MQSTAIAVSVCSSDAVRLEQRQQLGRGEDRQRSLLVITRIYLNPRVRNSSTAGASACNKPTSLAFRRMPNLPIGVPRAFSLRLASRSSIKNQWGSRVSSLYNASSQPTSELGAFDFSRCKLQDCLLLLVDWRLELVAV